MTRHRQDAEDLVQDTYLKAVRGMDRYRDEAGCRAWLFRILTNTYIDLYRKRRRAPIVVEFDESHAGDAPDGPEETDDGPDDLEDSLSWSFADEVKAAIDDLPDVFRELIVLRDVEGFSYRECADMLEIPLGTVMSRLHRGRRILQRRLRGYAVANGYLPAPVAERV